MRAARRVAVLPVGFRDGSPSIIHIQIDREGDAITGVRIGGQTVYVGQSTIQVSD